MTTARSTTTKVDTESAARAISDYVRAGSQLDDRRDRFQEFSEATTNPTKLRTYLRRIETDRLLTGRTGASVARPVVEFLGAAGREGSDARDMLFFEVTSLLEAGLDAS